MHACKRTLERTENQLAILDAIEARPPETEGPVDLCGGIRHPRNLVGFTLQKSGQSVDKPDIKFLLGHRFEHLIYSRNELAVCIGI